MEPEHWAEFIAANAYLAWGFGIWLALCVGSFLNVVIFRLPIMMDRESRALAKEIAAEPTPDTSPYTEGADTFNLMVPRSRCQNCGHSITALQNIPVVSWLLMGGKCSGCKTPISPRYPLVEALTGVLSALILWQFGFTWLGFACLIATWMLIGMAFIDADTMLLPDQLTLPLLWLGLIVNSTSQGITSLTSAVWGAVIGYLVLWSIYWLFKLITGKEGMGYGDFKLLAALGAWLGWQALPAIVLVSSVAGVIYAVFAGLFQKGTRDKPMPFGPFLALAGWVCLLQRDNLLTLYGFQ